MKANSILSAIYDKSCPATIKGYYKHNNLTDSITFFGAGDIDDGPEPSIGAEVIIDRATPTGGVTDTWEWQLNGKYGRPGRDGVTDGRRYRWTLVSQNAWIANTEETL